MNALQKQNQRCAINKLARKRYQIESTLECGISLTGTEAKSFRMFGANLKEGYVIAKNMELFLYGVHIPALKNAAKNHNPSAIRKLLAHKSEIRKISSKISAKGKAGVPMSMYVNNNNLIKVGVGIGSGKTEYNKKKNIQERDMKREIDRDIKENFK